MIKYLKQSLFDAPPGSYILHACNAQGVWGAGIAKEFKFRYPKAYDAYKSVCRGMGGLDGQSLLIEDSGGPHIVCCLIASIGYGKRRDSEEDILLNTRQAVVLLLGRMQRDGRERVIYSNKFNSGLFGVPWEKTEAVLKSVFDEFPSDLIWYVCDPEM